MSLTLILTRHAKSDWSTQTPSDHARPLNARGRKSASVLGDWIRALPAGQRPQQALSSSAARTRETLALMELSIAETFTERLYLATPEVMLRALQEAEAERVLMLGHNPGIAEFAHQLVDHTPDHARFEDYPTGATTLIQFDICKWSDLRLGTGRVLDFVVPRELLAEPV